MDVDHISQITIIVGVNELRGEMNRSSLLEFVIQACYVAQVSNTYIQS